MGENIKIWHSPDEIPDICKTLLVERKDGVVSMYVFYTKAKTENWIRWAYIKDILNIK